MADKGSKTEVEELENVDTAQTDTAQKDTAPAEAPTEYDATKDIMMNITLYKTGEGEKYKIYIEGPIKVTKPGKNEEEITIDNDKKLVFDSEKQEEKDKMIKAITDLINGSPVAAEEATDTAAKTPEVAVKGDAAPDAAVKGGYSSRSVSFRPSKKRRTAKKRRGRK